MGEISLTVAGAIVGGIVAAKNGGNVWAGIGIGAAAGGLVGLGWPGAFYILNRLNKQYNYIK